MGSGRNRGGGAGGIGIGSYYGDDDGCGVDLDLDPHAEVGGMKSMVFWTVLALAATFSASWVQKDEVSNPVAVVQQQVVPQFPVQAGGNMAQPSGEGPVVNAGPAPVVPRAIPGMPGPPPGTSVVVAQPIPGNPVRTLTRPVIIQPGAARPQPLAPPPGVAH